MRSTKDSLEPKIQQRRSIKIHGHESFHPIVPGSARLCEVDMRLFMRQILFPSVLLRQVVKNESGPLREADLVPLCAAPPCWKRSYATFPFVRSLITGSTLDIYRLGTLLRVWGKLEGPGVLMRVWGKLRVWGMSTGHDELAGVSGGMRSTRRRSNSDEHGPLRGAVD